MKDPPQMPKPPEIPRDEPDKAEPKTEAEEKKNDGDDPLAGEVIGAPA